MLLTFGNVRFHPTGDMCSDTLGHTGSHLIRFVRRMDVPDLKLELQAARNFRYEEFKTCHWR
jgi:hypothetical protein